MQTPEFLLKTQRAFEMKDAITDALSANGKRMQEELLKSTSPGRYLAKLGFGTLLVAGVLLPAPFTALFLLAKAALAVGGFAVMGEAVSDRAGGNGEVRFAAFKEMDLRFADADNQAEIARLQARLPFQTAEVREKFKQAFEKSAAKRAAFETENAKTFAPSAPALQPAT